MKKSFGVALPIVILLGTIVLVFIFSNILNETTTSLNDSTNSIILKIPITENTDPNGELSNNAILSYNTKTIQLTEDFSIDPTDLNFGECAPKIVFRLDGIQKNSITLSISEMQFMNGEIHSQGNTEKFAISDGNCIAVTPMCTDLSISYCFEIKKDMQTNIELYYSVKQRGIMPFPTN